MFTARAICGLTPVTSDFGGLEESAFAERAYIFLFSKGSRRGFGGLEVACWPLVPKFVGSNTAEAVGFFRAKKSSARLPSEGK